MLTQKKAHIIRLINTSLKSNVPDIIFKYCKNSITHKTTNGTNKILVNHLKFSLQIK